MEAQKPKRSKLKRFLPPILVVVVLGFLTFGFFVEPTFLKDTPMPKAEDTPASNVPTKLNLYQASVSISSRAVSPASVKIKKGDSVAWLNKDRSMHLIVSDTGLAGFAGQGALLFNDMYLFTFSNPGTYGYHDQLNPALKGTVIVE